MDKPESGQGKECDRTHSTPRKAVYRKPVLETYGPVSELTRGGGFTMIDGFMTTKMSDARAKQCIVRVGTHELGVGVYAYLYRPAFRDRFGHGLQVGVMADEVAAVLPAAVTRDEDGYWRVDYAMLAGARH